MADEGILFLLLQYFWGTLEKMRIRVLCKRQITSSAYG